MFWERIGKKVTTEIKKTTLKVLRLKERHRMSTFCIQISQIRDVYSATPQRGAIVGGQSGSPEAPLGALWGT